MRYEYIIDDKGFYYVPRPSSVCEGQKRTRFFREKMGIEPTIISPTAWSLLKGRHEVLILEEKCSKSET